VEVELVQFSGERRFLMPVGWVLVGMVFLAFVLAAGVSYSFPFDRDGFKEGGVSLLHQEFPQVSGRKFDVAADTIPGSIFPSGDLVSSLVQEDTLIPGSDVESQMEGIYDEEVGETDGAYPEDIPLPVDLNRRVKYSIRYFQKPARKQFSIWLRRYGKYEKLIKKILIKEGVPGDFVYLAMIESGFSPNAVSRAGAVGIWQFMYWTGKKYGLRIDWWVDERRDFERATIAAARYLKDLYEMFGSWYLAAAAYNVGEGKIDRAIRRYRTNDYWKLVRYRYLPRETKNYVPKMLAALCIVKEPEKYGFDDIEFEKPLKFDTVPVPGSVYLKTVAKAIGVEYKEILELNPSLRRDMTPPEDDLWDLRVPAGKGEVLKELLPKVVAEGKVRFILHRIRRGDSVYRIARKYGADVSFIKKINGMSSNSIRGRRKLIVPVVGEGNRAAVKALKKSSERELAYVVKSLERSARYYYLYRRGNSLVYIVKKGDSLYKIARRFGTSVRRIKAINGLRNNLIRPGQRLVIRVFGKKRYRSYRRIYRKYRVSDGKKIYTVRRGDTLYDISKTFGISIEKLKRINGLESELIHPGMKLVVGFAG